MGIPAALVTPISWHPLAAHKQEVLQQTLGCFHHVLPTISHRTLNHWKCMYTIQQTDTHKQANQINLIRNEINSNYHDEPSVRSSCSM